MLSNAYFLAKFRFDTAENEPIKNLQNFVKKNVNFANFANSLGAPRPWTSRFAAPRQPARRARARRPGRARPGRRLSVPSGLRFFSPLILTRLEVLRTKKLEFRS